MNTSHRQQRPRDMLDRLRRDDKWYLGGGDKLIWAPPFPQWLETPGFWDKANYHHQEFAPIFTWTFLDEHAHELTPHFLRREWRPDRLRQWYPFSAQPLTVIETRCLLPGDVLISECQFINRGEKSLSIDIILWTCHESWPTSETQWLEEIHGDNDILQFAKVQRTRDLPHYKVSCALGILGSAQHHAIQFSQSTANFPRFSYTPFYEAMARGHLADENKISGDPVSLLKNSIDTGRDPPDGFYYLAQQYRLRLQAGAEKSLVGAAAFHEQSGRAVEKYRTLRARRVVAMSQANWQKAFALFPSAELHDPYLNCYLAYREYGLRLMSIAGSPEAQSFPAICEGVDYFHLPISYSAFCHMREMRWCHDPAIAQGSLRNFVANQLPNGRFPGRLYPFTFDEPDHYHADWGGALLAVHAIHPDDDYLRKVYPALCRLQEFYDRERDPVGTGLYDIINHYETGQEYMRRYQVLNPQADLLHWGNHFRLKGVDLAVYQYRLKEALAFIAKRIGKPRQVEHWQEAAHKTGEQILRLLWDPQEEMFFDLDSQTMKRTGVKAAVCFYPYLTELVTEQHLPGLKRHLFNPKEFWTLFPVPSTAVDDPGFSADAEWKGKRHNCPWNGRVWPMVNSHIAECLGVLARRFQDDELRQRFVEFFEKYIKLLFDAGNPARPNCFEHYNPFTGRASVYRGVDDYQHSWILDLYMQYVFGIAAAPDGRVLVDPFPFELRNVRAGNILVRNHMLEIRIRKHEVTVTIDRKEKHHSRLGEELALPF